MGIIRSNFQGIVRLFGKEFRVALRVVKIKKFEKTKNFVKNF